MQLKFLENLLKNNRITIIIEVGGKTVEKNVTLNQSFIPENQPMLLLEDNPGMRVWDLDNNKWILITDAQLKTVNLSEKQKYFRG